MSLTTAKNELRINIWSVDEDVTPAHAGVQGVTPRQYWMPGSVFPSLTFAGMTGTATAVGAKQSAVD